MLWAAFTIVFYGFLCVSEYVNFSWHNISYYDDYISIFLYQPKADPFRQGHNIHVLKTNSPTCPYHAFNQFKNPICNADISPDAPVYQAGWFAPLSCIMAPRTIRQLLSHAGFNHTDYASHSF